MASVNPPLTIEGLSEEAWFPKAAARALEPAAVKVPEGFEAWRLHTEFDSMLMAWPSGDIESADWWGRVIPVGGGGKRWGSPPELDGASFHRMEGMQEPTVRITQKEGSNLIAKILPLDGSGHARKLAEIGSDNLRVSVGGIQVSNRDLIVFYEETDCKTAFEVADEAIANGDFVAAADICQEAGAALGRFHCDALTYRSEPNDERRWNDRLKQLEDRLKTNTLWRAPHTKWTTLTLTHRNFGLELVDVIDEETCIVTCYFDGVPNAILPKSRGFPVVRDLAAGYRSISRLAEIHDLVYDKWLGDGHWRSQKPTSVQLQETERYLRMRFFSGWRSEVNKVLNTSKSLDGNKGGVPVWEYEQVLEEIAFHRAWGLTTPDRVTWWMEHVNRIQAILGVNQTIGAVGYAGIIASIGLFFVDFGLTYDLKVAGIVGSALFGLLMLNRKTMRGPPPF